MPALPLYTTVVTEHRFLNSTVMEIRLATPAGFSYTPGQFIQVVIPGTDGKVTRSYSLASTPNDPYLELCMKVVPGGTTDTYFQHLRVGDTVTIRGPLGQFTNTSDKALGLVATGAGLAPIMGILRNELMVKQNTKPIHVWFGVRSEEDLFWVERLETLARDFSHFTYTLTLSQPGSAWNGNRGRVTEHIPLQFLPNAIWFLCGSKPMVQEVREMLFTKGVPPQEVRIEIF